MLNQNIVHILGGGSIGQLTACYLRKSNVPVALLASSSTSASRLRDGGSKIFLERNGSSTCLTHPDLNVTSSKSDMSNIEEFPVEVQCCGALEGTGDEMMSYRSPISRLIVATKSTQAVSALQSVRPRLSDACQIVLLQNGVLGVYQEVCNKILQGSPSQSPLSATVVVGSVTHGAYRKGPNHVVHSGMGSIKLARVDPTLPDLMDGKHQRMWDETSSAEPESQDLMNVMLRTPGLAAEMIHSHQAFLTMILQKLAVNCAVNPVTALLGCLNHRYSDSQWGKQMAESVCQELVSIYGVELLGVKSESDLADLVLQVAKRTGENKNSMLQDCEAKRSTEVDYLNGYVVKHATNLGMQAPVNSLLHGLIKAKEETWLTGD
ncbi:hypothetical protein CEUSTIGMA_g3058.t1 [Chlamydomonas eustigma]|uniref:2-dehydropantoate 2-reductase n=1 Tax=Chlamydomonas eustigma TaxID=1157962 RepID=A0A250WXQ1_9CHLO|nr:hypothetical protein CEUSTIGMA_g3058.t1 [Chlamydomonas eustigma]|eukprot:GAX75614.1 hypothetical protein CEUSTIGMA_g3058.t1 [Chlamydomonas eustigma]